MTFDETTNSAGQTATGTVWLDLHFEACRPEYEHIIRSVGIERGWHVLDAGCGAGSFVPLIAEAVGSRGKVTAVDHAPDNIERVEQRLKGWSLPCKVDVQMASLQSLPFADHAFDAVWLANTSQYLPDDELARARSEFHRILKRGGTLPLKDVDLGLWAVYPGIAIQLDRFFLLNLRWTHSGDCANMPMQIPTLVSWLPGTLPSRP